MAKHYFVDSENVGDSWVALVEACSAEDQIIVFYTQKSPHMSYKSLVQLKCSPKNIEFIECGVGNNALDFQLCTELGYRVHDIGDNEFLIVTNDTGYEAAANYWKRRGVAVRRIPGNLCMKAQPGTQPVVMPQQQQQSTGRIKSVRADSAKQDSVNAESVKQDAAKTDIVKQEAAPAESAQSGSGSKPVNAGTGTAENAKAESGKPESAGAEPVRTEHGKREFGRRGRSRTRTDRYGRRRAENAEETAEAERGKAQETENGKAALEETVPAVGNASVPAAESLEQVPASAEKIAERDSVSAENVTDPASASAEEAAGRASASVEAVAASPKMQNLNAPEEAAQPEAASAAAEQKAQEEPAPEVQAAPETQPVPAEQAVTETQTAQEAQAEEASTAEPRRTSEITADETAPVSALHEQESPQQDSPAKAARATGKPTAEPAGAAGLKGSRSGSEDAAREILYILGRENLQMLHESLQQIFGPQKGKDYYNSFKTGSANNAFLNAHKKLSAAEKKNLYCSIVFDQAEAPVPLPADFAAFVSDTWKKKKNLNSFRSALQSKYGRAMCNSYYSLIKSHMKILDTIS